MQLVIKIEPDLYQEALAEAKEIYRPNFPCALWSGKGMAIIETSSGNRLVAHEGQDGKILINYVGRRHALHEVSNLVGAFFAPILKEKESVEFIDQLSSENWFWWETADTAQFI